MAQSVGTIWVVNGDVYIQSEDGTIRKAKAGDEILANDLVKTFDGAMVDIRLANGQILTLSESKEMLIDKSVYNSEEFAKEDVDVDVEEIATKELSSDDMQTAAGEQITSHSTLTAFTSSSSINVVEEKEVTIEEAEVELESVIDYSQNELIADNTMDIEIVFPDAPTIEIPNITNRSGNSIDVTIEIPEKTEVVYILLFA